MKIQTTIISFLLIAGITTSSAQNAYNAYNSYFKASGGFTDAQGKGSLHTLLNSTEDLQTTSSGLDLELDSSFIFSLEDYLFSFNDTASSEIYAKAKHSSTKNVF